MRFWGHKKKQQPVAESLRPPTMVFGVVPIPYGSGQALYGGLKVSKGWRGWTVEGICQHCGGRSFHSELHGNSGWEEVKLQVSACADCTWLEQAYPKELAKYEDSLNELDTLAKKLKDALSGLPGTKRPEGFGWDELETAGLILHRRDYRTVLSFILIDYSREDMHRLIQAVDGGLHPFSRGFELFLGTEFYKLFPGSYDWSNSEHYSSYRSKTYHDCLHEDRDSIEARAEGIRSRQAEYAPV